MKKARKAEKCVMKIYRERKWNLLSDERWNIENWEESVGAEVKMNGKAV